MGEMLNIVDNLKNISITNTDDNNVAVLYQSEHFLVVNKPYDMVINTNNPDVKTSIQLIIREMFPNLINPKLFHEFYFIHRLDFATSGILCIALSKKSAQAASLAFEQRTVEKYYLALVHGHVSEPFMIINDSIGEDIREINGNRKMCTDTDEFCHKPRKACTALLVLEQGFKDNKAITKVLLYPKTGRRHQLRVHCKHIGHVIVGDYTYSEKTDIEPYRTFLHALRLIIHNTVEHLDIQTDDPFMPDNSKYQWKSTKVFRVLNKDALLDIKQLSLGTQSST